MGKLERNNEISSPWRQFGIGSATNQGGTQELVTGTETMDELSNTEQFK